MPRTASLPIFLEAGRGNLQQQIYRSIRQCIVDGRVSGDRRLPSTRSLAADLGVSRTTTLLALEQLRAEGYITSRRGAGNFIASRLPGDRAPQAAAVAETIARPPFSRRGQQLAKLAAPDRRISGTPPRAFRLGTPALDLFPNRLWAQLTRECLRRTTPGQRDYSQLAGLTALREAIAEQVQVRGTRCSAAQVQVVMGAQRGLDLVARMLLDPGDVALLEDPGYPGARGAMLAASAEVRPVSVDAQGMDILGAESSEAVPRLAYVTPSCQFPLGMPMSIERRRALLDWARRSQAWIVEDDYDCDIRHDREPLPCLHAMDPDGRVIYLGTFSKTLFPALRLGFLIAPRDLHDGFVAARLATDLHPPVLEQRVLAAFIQRGHYDRHLRRMQAAYAERLDALRRALARSGGPFKLRPVQAGMHAVVDVEGVSAERVHEAALASGIETMPLSAYYRGEAPRPNALLLGFGAVTPAAIRAGVMRLVRAAESAPVMRT
ncbi:MAG TPA: PLP-dependent aminotransferase family protein [Steroidobacteraceae bacterium]|nr:PLP-dependent aminotransferase family protein [Steroidobacteraceae bacterium]